MTILTTIILGLLLVILGIIVYEYFKGRRSDDTNDSGDDVEDEDENEYDEGADDMSNEEDSEAPVPLVQLLPASGMLSSPKQSPSMCSSSTCSSNFLLEPAFNLRECTKQLILLEDHLSHPRKVCKDCVLKHCLTTEALAEEASSLDKDGKYKRECEELANNMRLISASFLDGTDPALLSQHIRVIRKPMMIRYGKV